MKHAMSNEELAKAISSTHEMLKDFRGCSEATAECQALNEHFGSLCKIQLKRASLIACDADGSELETEPAFDDLA